MARTNRMRDEMYSELLHFFEITKVNIVIAYLFNHNAREIGLVLEQHTRAPRPVRQRHHLHITPCAIAIAVYQ